MIAGRFTFGDSRFDKIDHYFHTSAGHPVNQNQCLSLLYLGYEILYEYYEQMAAFGGSIGQFFDMTYTNRLRDPEFAGISATLAAQIQEFHHVRMNNYEGSLSWFDLSARMWATGPYTLGSQWLTWRHEGFITMFDFIAVSFHNLITASTILIQTNSVADQIQMRT